MAWISDITSSRVYFNRAWLAFTGRALSSEAGFGWTENIHPGDSNACIAEYVTAFNSRGVFSAEYRIMHKTGEYRWVRDSAWPFDAGAGNFYGYLGFCQDVTDKINGVQAVRGHLAAASTTEFATAKFKTYKCAQSYDILIAEDNLISYILFEELLKKMGHRPHKAEDGLRAVEMVETNRYDIIFMDIQMPVLDGYEAARRIRKIDAGVPIVAITANAIKGDYEKCMEAGMNDYLCKPVDIEKFGDIIKRNVKAGAAGTFAATAPESDDSPAAFDRQRFVRNTFSDDKLARDIIKVLFEDLEKYLAIIKTAAAEKDSRTVYKSAHRLKGSAINVCADRLKRSLLALETAGSEERFDAMDGLMAAIADEISIFSAEIKKYGYLNVD
jgi:PAS domain S-box-containing protein